VTLTCRVLDTGHCLASEHHLMQGGAHRTIRCHSIVALLGHPRHGWLLWDAGYHPRLLEATERLPFRIYRWVTPMHLQPERAAAAQLARLGVRPGDVRRVLLSHFHADHVAGLRDFPDAQWLALEDAWADVEKRQGLRALSRAFVPALLPEDFARRATLLPELTGPPLGPLGPTHDLFGDGSAVLVALPGHARGQLGLLARTDRGPVFFVADSCWLTRAIRLRRPPHRVTNLFADDPRALRATLSRLHTYARDHPEVALVPSHCPDAFRALVGEEP
jgi:glyoxylase-like metal-dependent hydrolase (beta-lactamase superfamily II)